LLRDWEASWPVPSAPSDALFDELASTGSATAALAAAATDPARLDALVRSDPSRGVAEAAAANPYLSAATTRRLAGDVRSAELATERLAANQLLADHVST